MLKNNAAKLIAVIAVVLIAVTVVLMCFGGHDGGPTVKDVVIRTPAQMLFGLSYKGEATYDADKLEDYVLSDAKFADYVLKDEYCMMYQLSNETEATDFCETIGFAGELPAVDYRDNKLLLSVGREIISLNEIKKTVTDNGKKMVEVAYGEEYHKGKVFIYTTRNIKFISGNELELYYLEKMSDQSNLVEGLRDTSELISEGEYHKLYKKSEDVYEYLLYSTTSDEIAARAITSIKPEIQEISATLVKIITGSITVYYNAELNIFSENIPRRTIHVAGDIVAFVKEQNGEVRLVVRHVYDTTQYVTSFRLPFTENYDVVDSVLSDVNLVDESRLSVSYYTGTNRILKTEVLRIVPIK